MMTRMKSGSMMVRNMMMMMMRSHPPKKPGPDPPSFPGIKCSEHNVPRLGWRSTGLLEWVCMCNVPSYTILSLKDTP